jgi:hypothetical protein
MNEAQVQSVLSEALTVQTDFMTKNADLFQQFFFLQHQEMYRKARDAAFAVEGKPDIYWFREMRESLRAMETVIDKYMKGKKEDKKTINITVIENSDMAQFAARLLSEGYDDVNIFEGS